MVQPMKRRAGYTSTELALHRSSGLDRAAFPRANKVDPAMTDITLQNIRPKVAERLSRLAEVQGLALDVVASEALTIGLEAIEDRVRKELLNTREQVALKDAIEQIQKVPDAAFGLIGRVKPRG